MAKMAKKPTAKAEEALVKPADLIGFIHTQVNAIAAACSKVGTDRADDESKRHCEYYLDGAKQMATVIAEMVPPVKAADLIRNAARYANSLSVNAATIAAETNTDEAYVQSYINGARKLSDILIVALTKAKQKGGDKA